jgi:hypothetical protein
MDAKEFKRLTKQYARDVLQLIKKAEKPEKRVLSEEEEEDDVEEETPQVKAPPPPPLAKEDWVCAGQLWLSPPIACPKTGDKCDVKTGILHNGQRVTVCKSCFLARERLKNQEKRDKKKQRVVAQ